MSLLQPGHPAGRGIKENPVPGLGSLDADSDREMVFTGAGRPKQNHILGLGEEHPGAQMGDEIPVRGRLVLEVELLKIFVRRGPRGLDPGRRAGGLAFVDFPGEDRCQILLMGPAGIPGLVPETAEAIAEPRCTQSSGVVLDLSR